MKHKLGNIHFVGAWARDAKAPFGALLDRHEEYGREA